MDLSEVVALLAAGVTAGTVNAVAGGGSLISFPTLVALGMPPVAANVTNSIAVCPGYLASVYGSRTDLASLAAQPVRSRQRHNPSVPTPGSATDAMPGSAMPGSAMEGTPPGNVTPISATPGSAAEGTTPGTRGHTSSGRLLALVPTTVVGTAAGAALLLATPERAFELVVPFLVLGAAAALAFQERFKKPHARRATGALHLTVGLGAVYGGYFGAALGVMLVAALGLVLDATLNQISALKNAISAIVGLVTVGIFATFGPVNWAAVGILAPATLIGGYVGARLARRLKAAILRTVIVAVGAAVGVALLLRALS